MYVARLNAMSAQMENYIFKTTKCVRRVSQNQKLAHNEGVEAEMCYGDEQLQCDAML